LTNCRGAIVRERKARRVENGAAGGVEVMVGFGIHDGKVGSDLGVEGSEIVANSVDILGAVERLRRNEEGEKGKSEEEGEELEIGGKH